MCSTPKNPHRNPDPSATDRSGTTDTELSLSVSRAIAFCSAEISSSSAGYSDANTVGSAGANPGSGGAPLPARSVVVVAGPTTAFHAEGEVILSTIVAIDHEIEDLPGCNRQRQLFLPANIE